MFISSIRKGSVDITAANLPAEVFVGIDTSNYTTSAAAVNFRGEPVENANIKSPLAVSGGGTGLRQSDALFAHIKALPDVTGRLFEVLDNAFPDGFRVAAIGVSDMPRNVPGSYMPCFLAGVSAAECAAHLSGVPLFRFSHQEGHIEAALCSSGTLMPENGIYSFHLSGGTCELLRVKQAENCRMIAEIIARTLDITCGQLIDRCGVALGLSFPCGAELEKLAELSERTFKSKPAVFSEGNVKGINISGFENKFHSLLSSLTIADAAKFVFDAVYSCITSLLSFIPHTDTDIPVLFAGGVMSSHVLARRLREEYPEKSLLFAQPSLSSDNAVGTALLAAKAYKAAEENKNKR